MAMEKFHHTLTYEDKKGVEKTHEVTLQKFDQIPFGLIRRFRKFSESEQFFSLLEELLPDKDLAALDQCAQGEVTKLMKEWQKDAGIEAGESSGS